jgi:hypothetical protein
VRLWLNEYLLIHSWSSNLTTIAALSDCRGIVTESTVQIWAWHYKKNDFVALLVKLFESSYTKECIIIMNFVWMNLNYLLLKHLGVEFDSAIAVFAPSGCGHCCQRFGGSKWIGWMSVREYIGYWSNRTAGHESVVWYPTSGQYGQRAGRNLLNGCFKGELSGP